MITSTQYPYRLTLQKYGYGLSLTTGLSILMIWGISISKKPTYHLVLWPNIPMGASPRMTISTTAQSSQGGSSSSFNSAPQAPAFKSVIPKSGLKEQRVTIKIVRASMETLPNGKVEFSSQAQMHLDISESNANIGHITKEVQERWGNEYVLVTTDGLLLEDCDATHGKLSMTRLCICVCLLGLSYDILVCLLCVARE